MNLTKIFQLLPHPVLILAPDAPVFTITAANTAYLTFAGADAEQIRGKGFFEIFTQCADEMELLQKALADKKSYQCQIQSKDKASPSIKHFDVTGTVVLDDDGSVNCIIRSLTDITEKNTIQQNAFVTHGRLEEASMLMGQVQEMANFGNWRWDIVNNVVSWSDTLYNIYGLDRTSFKATFEGYQELLHPDDKHRVYQCITAVLQTGNDVVFEERIIRPDGEVRYLRSWGRVQTDKAGNPVRMIGACLEITESKLAESTLNNERQNYINAIEQQNRQLQEIAWMQSHGVRAPLVRIMGLVELLRHYESYEIDQPELLANILSSATELDDIIKDVSTKTEKLLVVKA